MRIMTGETGELIGQLGVMYRLLEFLADLRETVFGEFSLVLMTIQAVEVLSFK